MHYCLNLCKHYAMNATGTASNNHCIIAVAASKGGVGKTTLAYELAAALDAVLVDLDWDTGGATRMWGYDPGAWRTARLLDAFESGRAPRPVEAPRRPALVPSHPDLASTAVPVDIVTDSLTSWAGEWDQEFVVVDCHPGANPLTDGAMAAARLVVVPVVLASRELDALEGMLRDFKAYNLLVVPNKVRAKVPSRLVERMASQTEGRVETGPVVSYYRWLETRMRRSAVVLEPNPGMSVVEAAGEYRAVAAAVEAACGR